MCILIIKEVKTKKTGSEVKEEKIAEDIIEIAAPEVKEETKLVDDTIETSAEITKEEAQNSVDNSARQTNTEEDKLATCENSESKVLDEAGYMRKYGLSKENRNLHYVLIGYYNGHPLIDSYGCVQTNKDEGFNGRQFYLWIDNGMVCFLDKNINEKVGRIEIKLDDIEAFSLMQENATVLSFKYKNNCRIMFLDRRAYEFFKAYIFEKEQVYSGNINK